MFFFSSHDLVQKILFEAEEAETRGQRVDDKCLWFTRQYHVILKHVIAYFLEDFLYRTGELQEKGTER